MQDDTEPSKEERKSKEGSSSSLTQTAQSAENHLLLHFARFPLRQLQPRGTTGTVRVFMAGSAVTVQQHERVSRAFFKLVSEGFLSAPVLNQKGDYVGMIDMLDLVSFTVGLFGSAAETMSEADWDKCFASEKRFIEARVEDVMQQSSYKNPNPFNPLNSSNSVLDALQVFARTGIHSVPVLADGSVVGICTQSMIISLLSQGIEMLAPSKDKLIKDMHDGLCREVFGIREDERAIAGFKLMIDKGVRGIAIVNSEGKLVDTLSVRDLRGVGTNSSKFRRLYQPVKVFKDKARKDFSMQTPPSVLTVTEKDTLERVINLMDDGNIHRIFEVDEAGKPKHVISQVDVIRFVVKSSGVPSQAVPATAAASSSASKGNDQPQPMST